MISVWNEWEPEDDMNSCPKLKKVVGGKPMLIAVVDWIARDFGVRKENATWFSSPYSFFGHYR